MRKLLIVLPFILPMMVYAHKPVKVQSVKEAVAKYTNATATFEEWVMTEPSGNKQTAADAKFLKTLTVAKLEGLTIYKFEVKGDWGPIHGLVAIKDASVSGLEVLVYTEHEGAGVTMPIFLNQFKGLTKENLATHPIKALPKEPKTLLAFKEVIHTIFSR